MSSSDTSARIGEASTVPLSASANVDINHTTTMHSRPVSSADEPKNIEDERWTKTLEHAIKSLVSIKFIVCRKFDTWNVGSFNATGFIVDIENGIILTNKHVITDAPWIGRICFKNSEEVPCHPIYRDPIHDFGFIKFDKSKVKFMELTQVPLVPESAKIGLAVKVPGSDAGEKLAVLSGIIARLDRSPPDYGIGTYCDFNTFYIQASANTSGGSSGSPVIDIHGNAVALNAGGSVKAASSFFLPLPRIKVALDLIKQGKFVPRGTLQVEFAQKQYDEARRLGLPILTETLFRQTYPELNGILTVKHVIPKGAADGLLFTGDIVLQVNGKCLARLDELAEELDSRAPNPDHHVNSMITLTVFRDQKVVNIDLEVQCLHSVQPSRFYEIGGSTIHALSFQLARGFLHRVGAPFVADAGHMMGVAGIPTNSIIVSVNHIKTPDIESFAEVMRSISDGTRVPVRYYVLTKKNVEIVKVVLVESKWGRLRMASRDDSTGLWNYTAIPALLPSKTTIAPEITASYVKIPQKRNRHAKVASSLLPSMILVEWHSPVGLDGTNSKWSDGVGVIVDAELGLVLVDRSTIPTGMGRVFCVIGNGVHVPAKIVYMDPVQNLVIVKFDPRSVNFAIKAIEISPLPALAIGDSVLQFSISSITHLPKISETHVKGKGYFVFNDTSPPKFRQMNFDEFLTVHRPMNDEAGVLVDDEGRARALWLKSPESSSYLGYCLSKNSKFYQAIELVIEQQRQLAMGDSTQVVAHPVVNTIDVELTETYFHKARPLGVSEKWIQAIINKRQSQAEVIDDSSSEPELRLEAMEMDEEESDDLVVGDDKYTVITIRRVPATDSHNAFNDHTLQEGDMILSLDGEVVTKMTDMWNVKSSSAPQSTMSEMIIVRDGQEMVVSVPRITLNGTPSINIVHWAGAVFQIPHRVLSFTIKTIPKGVYISLLYSGSPAQRDGLTACNFVTHVNNIPTPTLSDFLEVVEGSEWEKHVLNVDPVGEGYATPDTSTQQPESLPSPTGGIGLERRDSGLSLSPTAAPAEAKSFKFRLVSLEGLVKIVTVEQCQASKLFWDTWRVNI
ncbi:hypothetical protein SmJEL517_g02385 [Synchytrium microbalum]|uniref:PDZ domain-containing protein n=1 Tax=Synchytrium microbalum TaxID=1806994 RepID=A0A507C683_9FUNG|nr:uncharacterized protein SmJEL517_g02385 [Synchytrium microbalum]TPX35142.1 hypothetical protein SmJEL517_g02385 [Synchytrium microbalum]